MASKCQWVRSFPLCVDDPFLFSFFVRIHWVFSTFSIHAFAYIHCGCVNRNGKKCFAEIHFDSFQTGFQLSVSIPHMSIPWRDSCEWNFEKKLTNVSKSVNGFSIHFCIVSHFFRISDCHTTAAAIADAYKLYLRLLSQIAHVFPLPFWIQ